MPIHLFRHSLFHLLLQPRISFSNPSISNTLYSSLRRLSLSPVVYGLLSCSFGSTIAIIRLPRLRHRDSVARVLTVGPHALIADISPTLLQRWATPCRPPPTPDVLSVYITGPLEDNYKIPLSDQAITDLASSTGNPKAMGTRDVLLKLFRPSEDEGRHTL